MWITVFKGSKIGLVFQNNTLFLLPQMLVTYTFLYFILPHLWLGHKKRFIYLLIIFLISTLLFTYAYRYFVIIPFRTGHFELFHSYKNVFTANNYFLILTITGFAAVIKFFRHWYQKDQSNQQLMHENATAELQFLKSQIHPHFLFNTLNNLYALTLKQSNKATEVVDKLSNLLKYMLHECNNPLIGLEREIEMLKNYIELEKLRYGNRLKVNFEVEGDIISKKTAPLLMLPFLENAFKHGSSGLTGIAQINMNIVVYENELAFYIINNFMGNKNPDSGNLGGFGLKNVEKRLQLLFGFKYSLKIKREKNTFMVEMKLPLTNNQPVILSEINDQYEN